MINKICNKCNKENNTEYKRCDICRDKDRLSKNKKNESKNNDNSSSITSNSENKLLIKNISRNNSAPIDNSSSINSENNSELSIDNSITNNSENNSELSIDNSLTNNSENILNNFKIVDRIIHTEKRINFIHPFSCKFYSARGGGKTTYIINYLNFIHENNLNIFSKIYFYTNSSNQDLFELLRIKIIFRHYDELEELKIHEKPTLYIFDDCMADLKNNKIIASFYTRGRHCNVSIFSLEQHCNFANILEKTNTDYYLLFKIHDSKTLETFQQKFCNDISFLEFNKMNKYCNYIGLPFIITLNNQNCKYRSNFNNLLYIKRNSDTEILLCQKKYIPEKKIINLEKEGNFILKKRSIKSQIGRFCLFCLSFITCGYLGSCYCLDYLQILQYKVVKDTIYEEKEIEDENNKKICIIEKVKN